MPSIRDELEIIRLVVAGIEKHARGDVAKLATGIIAELRQAGFETVRRHTDLSWSHHREVAAQLQQLAEEYDAARRIRKRTPLTSGTESRQLRRSR